MLALGIEQAAAAALLRFDEGIDDIRLAAADADADASERAGRQAVRQLLPGLAAVAGLIQAGAGADALKAPGRAPPLVERRIDDAAARRAQRHINRARVRIERQTRLPGLAAIGRLEDAPLYVWPPEVPRRRHILGVGIVRVNDDAPYLLAFLQPQVLPGRATVGGLIDPIAP